jgi:hypothetical protein
MHSTSKIGSFMTLRANGWSLDKIAKHINVSKGTVWSWDVKHQSEIHLLKHMQLERVQEQYLPSYEEELQSLALQLALQLARVEDALAKQDLATMGPAFLMQTSLQIRDRLSKMRQQAPLRTVQYGPIEPLPVTGCVTKDEHYPWVEGDPVIEAAEDAALDAEIAKNKAADTPPVQTPPAADNAVPRPAPAPAAGSTNGKPHLNGHGNLHHNGANGKANGSTSDRSDSTTQRFNDSTLPIRVDPCSSVVSSQTKTDQNRPKTPGGQNSDRSKSTTSTNEN